MSDLNCSEYSEKAIVVRGEATKTYKENLKTLGGKYNASLKGGAGWIFSKTSEAKVNKFISSVNKGDISPSSPVEERRTAPTKQTQSKQIQSIDIRMPVILQDIKTLMEGKDSEYKLSFLSSVTLLLTQNSGPVTRPTPSLNPVLRQQPKAEVVISSGFEEDDQPARPKPSLKPVTKAEVVISSDGEEEEEAPPRRRLLR